MGISAVGQILDVEAIIRQIGDELGPRWAKAALHLQHAAQLRAPVERGPKPRRKPGTLREAITVKKHKRGVVLEANVHWAYFVEKGHKIGDRRTGRARVLRASAKEMRRIRKETGDESMKATEQLYRREATKLNKEHAAGRAPVAARSFLEATVIAELPTVISILAGN